MADTEAQIGETLAQLAKEHKSPKALLKATLDRHPNAKKKDVARAAFRVMIEQANSDDAAVLQEIGLKARTLD